MEKDSRSLGKLSLVVLAGACVCAIGFVACVGDSDPVNPGPAPGDSGGGDDDPNTTRPDSSTGRDGDVDKDASGGCSPEMRFGTPEQVPGISGPDHDDQLTLTPDELKIFFTSLRPGGPGEGGSTPHNIWVAERLTKTAGFGEAKVLALNTSSVEGDPMLSPNGEYLYFTSNRVSGNGYDIFRLPAAKVNEVGATAESVPGINTSADEMGGYVIDDGTLFLVRTGPTPEKKRKIYQAGKNGSGFNAATPVSELASAGHDQTPVLSPDGRVIYWASDRSPSAPAGKSDIFMATREPGQPFGNIRHVDELATTNDETPGWISPDGCNLYFTRYSNTTRGDIYVARRR